MFRHNSSLKQLFIIFCCFFIKKLVRRTTGKDGGENASHIKTATLLKRTSTLPLSAMTGRNFHLTKTRNILILTATTDNSVFTLKSFSIASCCKIFIFSELNKNVRSLVTERKFLEHNTRTHGCLYKDFTVIIKRTLNANSL